MLSRIPAALRGASATVAAAAVVAAAQVGLGEHADTVSALVVLLWGLAGVAVEVVLLRDDDADGVPDWIQRRAPLVAAALRSGALDRIEEALARPRRVAGSHRAVDDTVTGELPILRGPR